MQDRKLDMRSAPKTGMERCGCGRETKSFEACSPTGCSTFVVCSGCFKELAVCKCEPATA